MDRLKSGDPEHVGRFLTHLRVQLMRALRSYGESESDAEDLAEDAILRLIPRLREAAGRHPPDGTDPIDMLERWGLQICRNLLLDRVRSRRLAASVPLRDLPAKPPEDEEPLWASFLANGSHDPLASAVGTLEPTLATVFRLRHQENLSSQAIGAQLGISVAAVGTRLHRARMRIRQLLLGEQDGAAPTPKLPQKPSAESSRTYAVGTSTLTLAFQDLTTSTAEVLVSSDDGDITMGGGVSAAILRAGGETILLDAAKRAPARLGDVVVTTAGLLPAKYIFHGISIGAGDLAAGAVVESITRKAMELLASLGLRSIALPAIGAGLGGFTHHEVATEMAKVIVKFLRASPGSFDVNICLYDRFGQLHPMSFVDFFEQFAVRTNGLATRAAEPRSQAKGHPAGVPRRGKPKKRIEQLQELGRLEGERQRLETRLALLDPSQKRTNKRSIQESLREIQERRIKLLSVVRRPTARSAVRVFVSYSHTDERLRKELGKHLSVLQRQGLIRNWHDRMIGSGAEWEGEIAKQLEQARVVLLLVSADFISSKYCFDIELKRALELHAARRALVVPIILRPVVFRGLPFAHLQALPRDARPVTDWPSRDAAFVDIVEGLREALESLPPERGVQRSPRNQGP